MGKLCEMVYQEKRERTLLACGTHKGLDYYVVSLGTHPCAYVDYKDYNVDEDDIYCHGGVTYHEGVLYLPEGPLYGNIIGWDYAHSGDYVTFSFFPGMKHTTDEMIADCIDVIEQIVKEEK